ncbi:hypothetical protein D082_19880 [Synechocystis sp. PCC 6714]|nr:hypothetical protein D082_19880 [Synechocystis sp. PCC 6714]
MDKGRKTIVGAGNFDGSLPIGFGGRRLGENQMPRACWQDFSLSPKFVNAVRLYI